MAVERSWRSDGLESVRDRLLAQANHHARVACELLLAGEINAARRHARQRADLVTQAD